MCVLACKDDTDNCPQSTIPFSFKSHLYTTVSYGGEQLYHGAFSQLFSVHSADPISDLNNYLQFHPRGNLSSQLYCNPKD